MGRNILSICDECEVWMMHLRGKESDFMQRFQDDHSDHEKATRIVSDYVVDDQGYDEYEDVTEQYEKRPPYPASEKLLTGKIPRDNKWYKIEFFGKAQEDVLSIDGITVTEAGDRK